MRIGLNLLHALPEIGGGWNYIANLVSALGECDKTNTYIAFVTTVSECLVPAKPNFRRLRINIRPGSRVQRVVYENIMLQLLAHKQQLDCMHWFASTQALINAVPGVVTVYDLHPFYRFANLSLVERFYRQFMMAVTTKRAPLLLPISQATAQDLQLVLHANPARMVVIPVILGLRFEPAAAEEVVGFVDKYKLPDRFWLYVAHMQPHKNHLRLLQAYYELKLSGFTPWPLVLRGDPKGAEADVMEAIVHLNLKRDVIILSRLDEAELPILYSAATALVFPSLYEGGGIPVVEAMACGCPVIASDIPPVKEFAGDAASYFDPTDSVAIAGTMRTFQSFADQRKRNRDAGLTRAMRFRAQAMVGKLLSAYSRVVENRRHIVVEEIM